MDAEIEIEYLIHTGPHHKTGKQRNAFWCAYTADKPGGGTRVAVSYGTLDSDGQTQVKDFPYRLPADQFVSKKFQEKLAEGYQVVHTIPTVVQAKGETLLALPKPEAPKTANLLEVAEARVATAVDVVTSGGQITPEQIGEIRAARAAWSELQTRFSELDSQMELINALYEQKVGV